jgi:predicted aspartyl protease
VPVDDVPNLMDDPPAAAIDESFISLNAITGICTGDTMQLRLTVGTVPLTALLDSGSTHNFISTSAARRLGLHFHDSQGAQVVVANGDRFTCCGVARNVLVRIGDEFFSIDVYAIPLDCHDVVLGVKYLRTLGPIL